MQKYFIMISDGMTEEAVSDKMGEKTRIDLQMSLAQLKVYWVSSEA